ncbi:MAG: hypothetical protein JWO69_201 [Thermoleophilia bacterium]|jgi:protein-disulfide isomerase-like protein with CxxC motif|nr:hypothetical protein [Thermoleophilia bacterium]
MGPCPSYPNGFTLGGPAANRPYDNGTLRRMSRITATLFQDPGCPWGYSALPALRTIEWRYGAQLDWRLVLIGLAEDPQLYVDRGYTPLASAQGAAGFRRYGMPITPHVRARMAATSPACRTVVAARLAQPGSEWRVLRALQFAQFTSGGLLDEPGTLRDALSTVTGIDADAIVAAIDGDEVWAAYERDRAETRTAAGTAGALQGKTANSDGLERFTAPSVVFELDGRRLDATGFQPVEVYDALIANLDPTLERRAAPADDLASVFSTFPEGLTTQEVAAILAVGNVPADRGAAEVTLLGLLADGAVRREPLGDDALWFPAA